MAAAPPPYSWAQTGTSTVAHAMSRKFVSATITAIPNSTRSPRRNRQPSASRWRYGGSAAPSSRVAGPIPRVAHASTRGREQEAAGVDEQRVGRTDHGDEPSGEGRAEHRRTPLDRRAEPGGALHRDAGTLDESGNQRVLGAVTWSPERAGQRDQQQEAGEGQVP